MFYVDLCTSSNPFGPSIISTIFLLSITYNSLYFVPELHGHSHIR